MRRIGFLICSVVVAAGCVLCACGDGKSKAGVHAQAFNEAKEVQEFGEMFDVKECCATFSDSCLEINIVLDEPARIAQMSEESRERFCKRVSEVYREAIAADEEAEREFKALGCDIMVRLYDQTGEKIESRVRYNYE